MLAQKNSIIMKFDLLSEQTIGHIKKYVGLTKAKYLVPVIDNLDLEANPRSSATGPVTDAIQDSIETDSTLFPFKTKGILLACSRYEVLERGRIKFAPENRKIEGILDGGHNTLAIGLYILKKATDFKGISLPRGQKNWDKFKELWTDNRDVVDEYLDALRQDSEDHVLDFYVPVELLVPRDPADFECVEYFKNELLEVCAARNNNVQLPITAKSNQRGYFDDLKKLLDRYCPEVSSRVEWKPNEEGDIKVQNIIALTWIPLALIEPVNDEDGKPIDPISANTLYNRKGSCMKQFERLMSSPMVTMATSSDYKRELKNCEVLSAFEIAAVLPQLYDYIFEMFPNLYNSAGGSYGRITAVKDLNNKRRDKHTPFLQKEIDTLSPEGYIMPLVYGLQALMEKKSDGKAVKIVWRCDPMTFLEENLPKIIKYYCGIFSMCDYDPQKIGKNAQSYEQGLAAFKMAIAGLL